MLTKIKRQDCLTQYQCFPLRSFDYKTDEERFYYPKVYKSYILTLPSKSFKGLVRALALEVTKLTQAIHAPTLIFFGDTNIAWLYQNNDYKPVKAALEYLANNNVGKRFNGALQVDTTELSIFIKHIAWLTRCNAALPYFHFIDPGQNIVGNICKYGNLHLDALKSQSDELIRAFMVTSKFEYGDKNSCLNGFGKTSAISGRQTVV